MTANADRFMRMAAVEEAVAAKRSWIYAQIAQGKFPKPVKIFGERASAWLESEIVAWQQERIRARDDRLLSASQLGTMTR